MSERPSGAPRDEGLAPRASARGTLSRHARSRAGVVLGALALAVLTRVAQPPAFDERSVERQLAEAVGGEVGPHEVVWEPSRGALTDLYPGRRAVFLARPAPGAPRDVYRAQVSVTPAGRPLSVRGVEALTRTPLGDEDELAVHAGRAVFATRFAGKVESVTVLSLEGGAAATVGVARPAATVAHQLEGDELVLWLDGERGSVIDLAAGAAIAGEWLPVRRGALARRADDAIAVAALRDREPSVEGPLPLAGFSPAVTLVPGGEPTLSVRSIGGATALVADGRQLSFEIVLGSSFPASGTGYVPITEARAADARPAVLMFELVSGAEGVAAGAFDSMGWLGPMVLDRPTIATQGGRLLLGPWRGGPWERASMVAAAQWSGDPNRGGRSALCVTRAGHLAIAWSREGADLEAVLPSTCARLVEGAGALELIEYGASIDVPSTPARTIVVARATELPPRAPPPRGSTWSASPVGQPTPTFLSALHTTSASALGEPVEVTNVDAARYDWAIVAGEGERAPRKGATLATALPAQDTTRARLAVGLGVGMRRGPRGLRVDGSTGHPFARKEGLLVVDGGLRVGWARDDDPDGVPGDAAELPMTLADGQVTAAGRKRGPRQRRMDLCVLDGEVVLAASEFDSHEANATVLGQLGCQLALGLDRGTDRPAWAKLGDTSAGPFPETFVVALDRPRNGAAGSTDFQAAPDDP